MFAEDVQSQDYFFWTIKNQRNERKTDSVYSSYSEDRSVNLHFFGQSKDRRDFAGLRAIAYALAIRCNGGHRGQVSCPHFR